MDTDTTTTTAQHDPLADDPLAGDPAVTPAPTAAPEDPLAGAAAEGQPDEWDVPQPDAPTPDHAPVQPEQPIEPETADQPSGDPVTEPAGPPASPEQPPGTETGDQPSGDGDGESAEAATGRKGGGTTREYALLEGTRLRDVLAEAIDAAGGELNAATLENLIANDNEKYRERVFRPLPTVEAINKQNAVRALHKRMSAAGEGRVKKHLGIFPAHYWTPETYAVGTTVSVSVDVVEDDD